MRNSLINRLIFVFGMLGLMLTPLVARANVDTFLDQDITKMENDLCGTDTTPKLTCIQPDAVYACQKAFLETSPTNVSFIDILVKWCELKPVVFSCPVNDPNCKLPINGYVCAENDPHTGSMKVYDWINNTFKKSPAYQNANVCKQSPPPPPPSDCGNGIVNQPDEECDDGGIKDGDGCDSLCHLEWSTDVDPQCYLDKRHYCKTDNDSCLKNNNDPTQCLGKLLTCLKDAMSSCSANIKTLASLGGNDTGPAKTSGDMSNAVGGGGGCSMQLASPNSASGHMNYFILVALMIPALRFKLRH